MNIGMNVKEMFLPIKGCQARGVWMVIRHGTRNPGDDDIELMRSRGPELRDAVVENHNLSKGMGAYSTALLSRKF